MDIENTHESLLVSQLAKTDKQTTTGTITSLTNSLTQALTNRDLDIIKFIFSNSDPVMISDTLKNFNNPDMYGKFLDTCNCMIDSFPNETKYILNWLYSFLQLKQDQLRVDGLLVNSPLLENNYLKIKTKTITPLLDVKNKLEFLLASNEARVLTDSKSGFGKALVTIDERMAAENEYLINNHTEKNGRGKKVNGLKKHNNDEDEEDEADDDNEDDNEDDNDMEEDGSDNLDEEEEELMYGEDGEERKGFENDDPMDEEDEELEKELERYEKREKQFKAPKKS